MRRIDAVVLSLITIGILVATWLLGASPSEEADWAYASTFRVQIMRISWTVTAALGLAICALLIVRRRSVSRFVFIIVVPPLIVVLLTVWLMFTPYFRW